MFAGKRLSTVPDSGTSKQGPSPLVPYEPRSMLAMFVTNSTPSAASVTVYSVRKDHDTEVCARPVEGGAQLALVQ